MDWFNKVPKTELHVHLEGSIPYSKLWDLINKYGGCRDIKNYDDLKKRFTYKSFSQFIEAWLWKNQFIREYDDFTLIAEAVATDFYKQNIFYAEVFYSPSGFLHRGLKIQRITEAVRKGLSCVPDVEITLIADLIRDNGPEQAMYTVKAINEVKYLGVIGVGLGGSEQLYPPRPFKEVFSEAKSLGFHTCAHAGEAAGPKSIWDVIKDLGVERIGHGIRAEEDEELIKYLIKNKIPLDMCPLSNVRTGVIKKIKDHPIRRYFEKGLLLTINTDDPKMFGNTLAEEYRLLVKSLGFNKDEIRSLILQGINLSWLPDAKKQNLIESFINNPSWKEVQ